MSSLKSMMDPTGISFEIVRDEHRPGTALDAEGVEQVLAAARDLGLSSMRMMTITGHDALMLQAIMPSTLIFIPSVGGITHNPGEYSTQSQLAHGAQVLLDTILDLAGTAN